MDEGFTGVLYLMLRLNNYLDQFLDSNLCCSFDELISSLRIVFACCVTIIYFSFGVSADFSRRICS